jgi:hypothetical protein
LWRQHETIERIIEIIDVDRLDAGFLDNLLFSNLRRLQAVRKVRDLLKTISDKKLLKLWGQAVIERAGRRCEYPDCNIHYTQLHPHHLYSRRYVTMRYNLDAGISLCPYHHTMGGLSAHHDPDFKSVLVATGVRTEEFFDRLREERNRVQKNSAAWKRECYERLKAYL